MTVTATCTNQVPVGWDLTRLVFPSFHLGGMLSKCARNETNRQVVALPLPPEPEPAKSAEGASVDSLVSCKCEVCLKICNRNPNRSGTHCI